MVVIAPIAIRAPAAFVFIPPAMVGAPAAFARFAQLMALMIGLLTIVAVTLDSFVELVVGLGNALVALLFVSAHARRRKDQKSSESGNREQGLAEMVCC